MMHISPSSNFQNLHENVDGDKDDDYEEDDYEEDDEEEVEKVENKSESIVSSTSRSTTTLAPVTAATETTTTPTTTTTAARTTTSTATTSSEEEEPAPFFPTRMTTAESVEKSSTIAVLPTKSSAVTTTTEEKIEKASTTETAKQEIDDKDKGTSLKDLLRSGKYGNDPVKIKELLKNMNPDVGGADKPNDQDEVDPKDIFKKYANMAKSKTSDVEVNIYLLGFNYKNPLQFLWELENDAKLLGKRKKCS